MRGTRRPILLAFRLCVFLCALCASAFLPSAQGANVRLWNIAPYSTTNSTHQLITEQISTNILSNGGVQAIGLPKRLTPAADGYVTNFYGQGFYAVKDAVTGLGLYVINVYDATTTQYDYTNLLTSGYNTYVVTTIVINTNQSAGLTPAQVGVMIQTSNNAAGLIYTNSFDPTNAAATVNTKLDLNSVNQTNNTANHSTNDAYGAAATVNTKLDLNSVNLTNNIAAHSTNDAAGAAATVNTKLDLNSVNLTNNIANHSTNDAAGAAATVNTKLDLNSVNLTNNIAAHSTNDPSGAASTVNTKLDLNSVNLTNNIANHSTNDAAGAASTVNTKLDLNSVNLTNNVANHSTNDPSGAAATVNTKLDLNSVNISNALSVVSGGGILTKNGSGTNTFLTNSPFAQFTNLMVVDSVGSSTYTPVAASHTVVLGGHQNTMTGSGVDMAILGGSQSTVSGNYSAIVGGSFGNTIADTSSFIGGGVGNTINAGGDNAIIGSLNSLIVGNSQYSTIVSGYGTQSQISNSVNSFSAGSANWISNANYSVTMGNLARAFHANAFVWNDGASQVALATTGTNQFLVHANGGIGLNTNAPPFGGVGINGNLVVNGTNVLPAITSGDATLNTKIDLNSVNQTNNVANHSTNDAAGAAAIVNTKLDLNSVNGSNNVVTLDTKTLGMGLNLTNQDINTRATAGRFTNTFVGLGWGTANFNTVFRLAGINAYTNISGNAAITNGVGYNSGIIVYIWTNNYLTIPPIATNGGGAIGSINFYTNALSAANSTITITALDGNSAIAANITSNTFSGKLNLAQLDPNGNSTNTTGTNYGAFSGDGGGITNLNGNALASALTLYGAVTNNVLTGQVRIDKTGVNATGLRNRFDKPFHTISAGVTASRSNDLITINGNYNENDLLPSNGLSYYFPAGSGLRYTNNTAPGYSIFDDHAGATTNSITGAGDFYFEGENSGDIGGNNCAVLLVTNPSTRIQFTAASVNASLYPGDGETFLTYGGNPVCIQDCAQADLNIGTLTSFSTSSDNISGAAFGAFLYYSGNCNLTFDKILTDYAPGINITQPTVDTNDVLSVHGHYLACLPTANDGVDFEASGLGTPLWWYGDLSLLRQESFRIDFIEAQKANAISSTVGGGGKIYIDAIKISNHSTRAHVIAFASVEGTNQLWLHAQKVTDNNGGGLYLCGASATGDNTNGSQMKLYVDQWEERATNYVTGIRIESGTHYINNGTLIMPNGIGLWQTNGYTVLNNMIIDCSAKSGPTNNPIFISGGTLILNNCTLIAGAGVNAIQATNAVTVTVNNCRIIGTISANVTVNNVGASYFGGIIMATNTIGAGIGYDAVDYRPTNLFRPWTGTRTNWILWNKQGTLTRSTTNMAAGGFIDISIP